MGEVLSVRLKVCDGWVAELGEFPLSAGFRDLRIMELALVGERAAWPPLPP